MDKVYELTQEGFDELKAEQQALIDKRPEMADTIATARDFGDLRENAEYSAAKEAHARSEKRIRELTAILANAKIIKSVNKDLVEVGCTVQLDGHHKAEYTIVNTIEANPLEGKVSNESPIGQALLGKVVGDRVEISLPAGVRVYTIKSIS